MACHGESLYFNATDQTAFGYRDETGLRELPVANSLATIPLEHALPIRETPSWKGKNTYEGDYWASTTRRFVHHESFLEREFLMQADFQPDIVGFSWQPFVLKWPRGTKYHRGHVPDFFVRLSNGLGLVVDVKRADKVEANTQQFSMTREACQTVGWDYQVFTGIEEPRLSTLTFLCGFRQDRYAPPSPEALEAISDAFQPSTSLEAGIRRAARTTGFPRPVVHGNVLHMIWHGHLTLDMALPLGMQSHITTANDKATT